MNIINLYVEDLYNVVEQIYMNFDEKLCKKFRSHATSWYTWTADANTGIENMIKSLREHVNVHEFDGFLKYDKAKIENILEDEEQQQRSQLRELTMCRMSECDQIYACTVGILIVGIEYIMANTKYH